MGHAFAVSGYAGNDMYEETQTGKHGRWTLVTPWLAENLLGKRLGDGWLNVWNVNGWLKVRWWEGLMVNA